MSTLQEKVMINPQDVTMLLIDHQSGLFNLVQDIAVDDLRRNVAALAKVASLLKIPVITTTSTPDTPNGPQIPEINQLAPHAEFVARQGQINAWDVPEFVQAIERTGRKTLVIAGTLTSVCLAFAAISARAAGYKVYAVVDASGNWSKMATDLTIARLVQAMRPVRRDPVEIGRSPAVYANGSNTCRIDHREPPPFDNPRPLSPKTR